MAGAALSPRRLERPHHRLAEAPPPVLGFRLDLVIDAEGAGQRHAAAPGALAGCRADLGEDHGAKGADIQETALAATID